MTSNQIAYFQAKETERHNKVMEAETGRHNVQDERIRTQSNLITESHYSRLDSETLRHNLATEEQARQQLNLGYAQLDLGNRQLSETTRHNMASESLQLQTLQESFRHNVQTERVAVVNANEAIRHNTETERMQDELNGSNITMNYARASNYNSSTKLNQAKTTTEDTMRDVNKAKVEAETKKLKKEAKYTGAKMVSETARNWADTAHNVVQTVGSVLKMTK